MVPPLLTSLTSFPNTLPSPNMSYLFSSQKFSPSPGPLHVLLLPAGPRLGPGSVLKRLLLTTLSKTALYLLQPLSQHVILSPHKVITIRYAAMYFTLVYYLTPTIYHMLQKSRVSSACLHAPGSGMAPGS